MLATWVVSGQTSAVTGIRLAAPADLDTLAATVVTAFDQDPAFRAFFGADPEFRPLAVAFATDLLRRRIATDSVWMTSDGDALAMWDPPAGTVATPARAELPGDALARVDVYDAAVHAAITAEPHWYLGVLASHLGVGARGLPDSLPRPGSTQRLLPVCRRCSKRPTPTMWPCTNGRAGGSPPNCRTSSA